MISNLRYRYDVTLEKRAARMPGHAVIQFDAATKSVTPLVIDFRDIDTKGAITAGNIKNLKVNNQTEGAALQGGHIIVPARYLKSGANEIQLDFDSGIAEANHAITRYLDTEDQSEYIYTLFVPMDAHLAFPLFDQPDLKARFTLAVTAPADWTVLSNGVETVTPAGEGRNRTSFGETRPISSYLFAFTAGPWAKLEGPPARPAAGALAQANPAMRLFVRKSQLARAKDEWPEISQRTRQGLAHLTEFFAQPFPFPRYDQILIPGFAYGGMEHAGSTFLNEDSMLFRSVPTANDHNRRSETVLHELAHQWFGDLVTMRWFDDLWLKEGFAQYMAYQTLSTLQPPDDVWKRFYNSIKRNAYAIDDTHGTTPIYQQITNLKDAKSAYGAIVYSKAPSLLKLLSYKIGENNFRDGVRIFLKEHAYANATWSDLIGAFSRASKTSLDKWADAWVQQPGMPQIEIDWACAAGKVSKLNINQHDVLGGNHLWPMSGQLLLAGAPIAWSIEGPSASVPAASGKTCPQYLFANDRDYAYGEFLLDDKSLGGVRAAAPVTRDAFQRALLWGALWDSVREARMPPQDFLALAMRSLPGEKDPELALALTGRARTTFSKYLTQPQRSAVGPRFEELLAEGMRNADTVDLRINSLRAFIDVAESEGARQQLKDLLAGKTSIPGVPLRQRDRWNIVATLVAAGDTDAEKLLAAERAADKTSDSARYAWGAGAGRPQAENKRRYFSDYTANSEVSEDWITTSLSSFNHWNESNLTLAYLEPALSALPQMKRTKKIFFVLNWLGSFVGGQSSPEALVIVNRFLDSGDLDPDLRLKVLEVKDDLDRAVRIQSKYK
jgi:aminopeptidase N